MAEQTTETKKRRRKKEYLLLTDFNCLTNDEVIKTIHEIRVKLKMIFKKHIGQDNHITPVELFQEVFLINPNLIDIYKKQYWWSILKGVLRQLRKEDELFVINRSGKLFVLQTLGEAKMFKEGVDRDIKNMKSLKTKADEWVRKKKWQNI